MWDILCISCFLASSLFFLFILVEIFFFFLIGLTMFIKCIAAAYSVKFDVYAFGVLLFNLTSKRALDKEKYTGRAIHNWAVNEYKSRHSYVDLSFQDNADFDRRDGRKITELTRQCMDEKPNKRPEMKEVFERLKGLRCSMAASW